MEKRKYIVKRVPDRTGMGTQIACDVFGEVQKWPLIHAILHSATGFETGYAGAGPSDLAVSILRDHFSVPASILESLYHTGAVGYKSPNHQGQLVGTAREVLRLHQAFKADFIAGRQLALGEQYEITTAEIEAWLERQRRAPGGDAAA